MVLKTFSCDAYKMLNVCIITPDPFPVGNVATNRFSTYAKALVKHGCDVDVIVMKGTEDPFKPENLQTKGVWAGIRFEYMAKSVFWNPGWSFLNKLFKYFYGVFRAVRFIAKNRPSSVLIYARDPFYICVFGVLSKVFSFRYLIDRSEYPGSMQRGERFFYFLYVRFFKIFDGVLVITKELERYYRSIAKKKADIFFLPMSVDLDRFSEVAADDICDSRNKDFFCVFGVHNRDCIEDTIAAFDLFCKLYPDLDNNLVLVGDYENLVGRDAAQKLLESSAVRNRIVLKGKIASNDMPTVLRGAMTLITTPRGYVSGGFPTKLGEYLATGKPVILTKVGELSDYLVSMDSCIFCDAGNVKEIAEAMRFVVENTEISRNIGKRGRDVAFAIFNADNYGEGLVSFFSGAFSPRVDN